MNSLTQYIDLYRSNVAAFDSGSAPALNIMRQKAATALEGKTLPVKGMEGFERTDVNEMFAPDYGLNITRIAIPTDVAASWRCDIPNMSTLLGVIINDTFAPSTRLSELLPEGVTFCSLKQAATDFPDIIEAHYGKTAPLENPTVALNTMLAQDGVFIHLKAGVQLSKPLQLLNIFSSPAPMLAPRRVLIVLGKDAKAQLLVCDHTQHTDIDYLSSEVVEINLAQGSSLDYCCIEESSAKTSRHSQIFVEQLENSSFSINLSTLTNGTTRNELHINASQPQCETNLTGMTIASAKMHVDNNVNMRHTAPHCHSSQLFKYVADEDAHCAFQGLILVANEAPFTDATQTCRSILASPKARMHAKPQLEIYNDEVKCGHGATTGQLDQDALFYMRARGINEKQAKTMLMQAFMADVIDTVKIEGLRDRMRHLVEKRFSGSTANCAECHAACHDRQDDNQTQNND